jgi:hypothetical protein
MHPRHVFAAVMRLCQECDDFVQIELGRIHDLFGDVTLQHGSRNQRAGVQNDRAAAHETLPLHRDELRVARTRTDKKHRHAYSVIRWSDARAPFVMAWVRWKQ